MSKEELLEKLKELIDNPDTEEAHILADELLLTYINDKEITEAFNSFGKWYA